MSLSVDYIQFLQKKIERLELEKKRLLEGLPLDNVDLPYVPELPESTFTNYQMSKELEINSSDDDKNEIGILTTRSNKEDTAPLLVDDRRLPVGNQWDEFSTVGGLLSQIPNLYNTAEINTVTKTNHGITNGGSHFAKDMGVDDFQSREIEDFINRESLTHVGLPMFRNLEQATSNRTILNGHKELNGRHFQTLDSYPSMVDIEDYGTWPIHTGLIRQHSEDSYQKSYIPTLPSFREHIH